MSLLGFATRGCCRPSCGRTDRIREIDAGPWKNESNAFENERLERFATALLLNAQVYYMDSTFAMGHVVIRRKRTVVGDENPDVILFRCIQNMNPTYPYNTCYTGGEPLICSNGC